MSGSELLVCLKSKGIDISFLSMHVLHSLFLRLQSKDRNSGEMNISDLGFGAFWSIEATCSILSSQHHPLSIQQDDKRQVVAVAVSVCGCAYVCTGKLQKGGEKAESFHPFSSWRENHAVSAELHLTSHPENTEQPEQMSLLSILSWKAPVSKGGAHHAASV